MTQLTLVAYFSHIDKYQRMYFRQYTVTREKLKKHVAPVPSAVSAADDTGYVSSETITLPYNDKQFSVVIIGKNAKTRTPGVDVERKIGLVCKVRVRIVSHTFNSKLDHNYGQCIRGWRLALEDLSVSDEPLEVD